MRVNEVGLVQQLKSALYISAGFLAVAICSYNYINNQIYVSGSSMLDVGWFTLLTSEMPSWPIKNPPILGNTTYFSTHFSPIFYISSIVYTYIGSFVMSAGTYFAVCIASAYGLVTVSVYKVVRLVWPSGTGGLILLLSAIAGLNGVALGAVGFPHFEIAIPALILLVIAFISANQPIASVITFIVLLTLREDAGFHAFLLFFNAAVAIALDTKKWPRFLLALAVGALAYSVVAVALQKTIFPGDSAFSRMYSGQVFYEHLTTAFLLDRLNYFVEYRAYIWFPWLVACYLGVIKKQSLYLAGFFSVLPWAVLCITAIEEMPNSFQNYYAFPFVVSSLWPLFAGALLNRQASFDFAPVDYRWILLTPILPFVLFIMPLQIDPMASQPLKSVLRVRHSNLKVLKPPLQIGHIDAEPWKHIDFKYLDTKTATEHAATEICRQKHLWGRVFVDESVSALMPHCVDLSEWHFANRIPEELYPDADTLIFFAGDAAINGSAAPVMNKIAAASRIKKIYLIKNTNILIATNLNIEDSGLDFGDN